MLQANELRINNWIQRSDELYECADKDLIYNRYVQITSLGVEVAHWKCRCTIGGSIHSGEEYKYALPIPLTPEILEKCGSFKKEDVYDEEIVFEAELIDGVIEVSFYEDMNEIYVRRKDSIRGVKVEIKYLHQLQNLSFALTNKEHEINL